MPISQEKLLIVMCEQWIKDSSVHQNRIGFNLNDSTYLNDIFTCMMKCALVQGLVSNLYQQCSIIYDVLNLGSLHCNMRCILKYMGCVN